MKKLGRLTVASLLVMASLTSASLQVTAASPAYTSVNLIINNAPISADVMPVIKDGRTLAPVRVISEELGVNVDYDQATKKVTVTGPTNKVEMTLGKQQVKVNGETQIIDVAPQTINGRTMLPLRFLGEALDCDVQWKQETKTVHVTGGVEKPKGEVDRFGREIRTTNLPKNASYFPYIAKDVPNWVYDRAYEAGHRQNMAWEYLHLTNNVYVTPADIYADKHEEKDMDIELAYEVMQRALNANLNIDYRTINATEYANICSTLYDQFTCKYDLVETANVYSQFYKDHKLISNAQIVVLPETLWKGEIDQFHMSAWVKFTAQTVPTGTKRFDTFGDVPKLKPDTIKTVAGKTYEGIVTMTLIPNRNTKYKDSKYPYIIQYRTSDLISQVVDNYFEGNK